MDKQDLANELHRVVTTAIIYNSEKKYLVTKRAPFKKVHPDKWTVPGGGLHMNDYINEPQTHGNAGWYGAVEKGLLREIQEEVGVIIDKPKYLLDMIFLRPDNIPVLVLSYYAKYISGDVILDEDNIEFKWATLSECKELDLIPGIYEEIEEVDQILKNNHD